MKSKMQSEQIVPTRNYADCKRTQCFNSLPIYGFWKPQTSQFGNCVWINMSWIWLKRDPTSDTPNMIVIINLKDIFCNYRDVFTSKTSYWMLGNMIGIRIFENFCIWKVMQPNWFLLFKWLLIQSSEKHTRKIYSIFRLPELLTYSCNKLADK